MKAFQIVITPLLLLCMALSLQAQNRQTVGDKISFAVEGSVFGSDEMETKPYPLPNASIHLTCLNDTTVTADLYAMKNGRFAKYMSVLRRRVKKNDAPRVRIAVSYMGYETFQKEYSAKREYFDDDDPSYGSYWEVDIDTIVLQSKPMSIQEVQIVGELQRMYESGDTTVFNVDAYQMPRGTVLLNLVRRLPGLRYEQGQLTYRDSVIHEIRLNGESFFAHDMKQALENIENSDLKQFRVYKTLADTLRADTTKHWVADMITKKPTNRVEMTKPELGTTDRRNTYHFAMQGLQWKSGNRGEWSATVKLDDLPNASMRKYSQNTVNGSFRRQFGKTSINYQPSFSYNDQRDDSESLSSSVMPDYEQYSQSTNQSNRYSSGINHTLQAYGGSWNGSMFYYNNDNRSHSQSTDANYSGNPFAGEDNELLDDDQLQAIALNRSSSQQQQRSHQESIDLHGSYSKYFDWEHGGSVNVRTSMRRSHQYTSTTERQRTEYLQYADSVWSYERQSITPIESNRLSFSAEFGFGFGPKRLGQHMSLGYEFVHENRETTVDYYDLLNNRATIDSISTNTQDQTDAHNLSLDYNITIKKFRISQELTYTPNRRVDYQFKRRDGVSADTVMKASTADYRSRLSYDFAERWAATLEYTFHNRMPNASTLVRPTTTTNPLYVEIANPHLRMEEDHSFRLHLSLGGDWNYSSDYSFTRNDAAIRNIFDTKTGGVTSIYDNINGHWSLNNGVNYRTDFKHANLSVSAQHEYSHNVNYQRTSGAAEEKRGISNVHNIGLRPRFAMFGRHYDLTVDGNYNYQWSNSNYATYNDKLHSFQLNSAFNYWLGNRLTLHTDLNLNGRTGSEMQNANRTDVIWNLGVEYKVLRDQRGLVKLQWFDILQQRRTYYSHITPTGRYEFRNSGIPHYVMLTFQYKLYKLK